MQSEHFLGLFGITSFRNGNIAAAIVSLGEFGLLFSLPLWLQNVAGYTAFQTGLVLLFLAGGSFLASGLGRGASLSTHRHRGGNRRQRRGRYSTTRRRPCDASSGRSGEGIPHRRFTLVRRRDSFPSRGARGERSPRPREWSRHEARRGRRSLVICFNP